MRIRSKFASVASPSPEDLLEQVLPAFSVNPQAPANAEAFDRPLTLWALRPLSTNQGRAVGIRLIGDVLKVALVQAGSIRWLPAKVALTEHQAARWAKDGQFYKS